MTTFTDPTDPKCLLGFRAKLTDRLNEYRQKMGLTYFDGYTVIISETPKYFKIFSVEMKNGSPWRNDGGRNIVAFVDKVTGGIFKPASYKVPAKHARGNIMSDQNGMEAITESGNVIYLK